jgi:hypothetical protein
VPEHPLTPGTECAYFTICIRAPVPIGTQEAGPEIEVSGTTYEEGPKRSTFLKHIFALNYVWGSLMYIWRLKYTPHTLWTSEAQHSLSPLPTSLPSGPGVTFRRHDFLLTHSRGPPHPPVPSSLPIRGEWIPIHSNPLLIDTHCTTNFNFLKHHFVSKCVWRSLMCIWQLKYITTIQVHTSWSAPSATVPPPIASLSADTDSVRIVPSRGTRRAMNPTVPCVVSPCTLRV